MSTSSRRRQLGSVVGAFIGLSAYKRFEHNPGIHNVLHNYYNSLSTAAAGANSIHIKAESLVLISIFLVVHLVKWAIFGKLTANEIKRVRAKVGYTMWEFSFGFIIFYCKCFSFDVTLIRHELFKYAGLFLCVLLLKSFHYLSHERVLTLFTDGGHPNNFSPTHGYVSRNRKDLKYFATRFSIGLILLNLIDALLVFRFFYEVFSNYSRSKQISFKDNILLSIFGFEILKVCPLIISTSIKFTLNCYEHRNNLSVDSRWLEKKLNITNSLDFLVSFARFSMVCTFSVIFLYFYTFPFHILPSSYSTFRLLVDVTRNLINLKKKKMLLSRLRIPPIGELESERCIICYDLMEEPENSRTFGACNHKFHYNCLSTWFDYSKSCPICRSKAY